MTNIVNVMAAVISSGIKVLSAKRSPGKHLAGTSTNETTTLTVLG
jgi:hypothetical protein